MGQRREARELALKCLHQWDQQPDSNRTLALNLLSELGANQVQREFAVRLLDRYWERAHEVDECLRRAADRWRLERMAGVVRTILRLAATELLFLDDIPPRVTLDEAIELAKRYSSQKSSAFVNGILDRILAEQEQTEREQTGGDR